MRALKNLPAISTLLVVYVDDLFCGRRAGDEPVVITKFLGIHHHITATPEIVRCCFDMSSFLEKSA
eukprot:6416716-Amphidinium_carterae.2